MTDRKIFLVSRSFSKEKASGKDSFPIEKELIEMLNKFVEDRTKELKDFGLEEDYIIASSEEMHERISFLKQFIDNILKPKVITSLMHVSEEEKCVELTPKLEEKIIKDVEDLSTTPYDKMISSAGARIVFQKLRESV